MFETKWSKFPKMSIPVGFNPYWYIKGFKEALKKLTKIRSYSFERGEEKCKDSFVI